MKAFGWYKELHDEAKDSPEYKATMEELMREEKILSEMCDFIAIGGDSWVVYLNINSIESICQDEQSDKCIVTTTSGRNYRPIETPIAIIEQINKVRKLYRSFTDSKTKKVDIMTCPECDQNADSGMNFCAFCGRQLWDNCLKSESEPK
ncbi:MAG: zinc ribbon domain-containing protein [Sphaerochaetaceae bacterium]|nr:zinc ribbon domain-containing protein [Sphaerochaetaceae bacterium]